MKKAAFSINYLIADFLAAFLAWIAFYIFRKYLLNEIQVGVSFSLLYSALPIATFWTLLFALWGTYVDVIRKSRVKELFSLFTACLTGVVVIFFALLLDDEGVSTYTQYYKTVSTYFLLHFTVVALEKMVVMTYTKRLIRRRSIWFNTLLIGSEKNALEIYQEVDTNHDLLGLRFMGYVHVFRKESPVEHFLPCLGDYRDLEEILKKHKIEQVIIAVEPSEHKRMEEILTLLEGAGVYISIIPDLYQILLGSVRVQHIFGTPLIEIRQNLMPVWQRVAKRLFDFLIALLVLVLGAPLYLIVALITRVTSPGPSLYSQERIGKDGQPFRIYKFRSMYIDAETNGPALSSDNDPRITPWGRIMRKTRLDETPQFFNVLKGEMSIVGPRPERQYFIDQITARAPHYKHLLKVRPGITSLGQVKYGYAGNVDEMVRRMKYDIIYIENMSLAMDMRILLYTIMIILQGRGK
ncbi:exopolysaccharide biosynthesis polyprenyl glycosylphosphotransferase [Catalinimonas alkaloidigena]|uniref:Exopolysaccharide biosynthesis polyprenyl glycosylphosphotransferase n=1 Tax=Catalinimonas alkaloidigena TaxID=1075417 RepID=A0A1G9IRK1_9BACT|nr:sugar transferase [Catalinimonas alkaloidigena]SDL27929.1 exopolysaccharide biosynthesis polyprenyl glycosylphosphotransferase [Catalinimonas alkaloidigena]